MDRTLDLELTRRCNLRCDYCFVGWSRDWKSDLPEATAREVITQGAGRFDLLHLTGGEPFVYRAIFDLIELGLSLGYAGVVINSNGTALDADRIARLGSYGGKVALTLSLDGPPELHDPVRGPGRHAQTSRTVDALLAAGVPVTVMTVVTPQVLAVLPDFLRGLVAAHPGLAGITLFPVGVGTTGTQKPGAALASLSPDELQLLAVQTAMAWHSGIPVTVGAWPTINPLLALLGYPRSRMYQCTAGRGRMCVHADLAVSSCHPVADPIYGRWTSGLFDRLDHFVGHRRLAERDFDGCRTCSHREGCGNCRAFVTASGAELYGNDRVCLDVVPGRREEAGEVGGEGEVVRRFFAILGHGRTEELDELVTADVDDRDPFPLQPRGRDGLHFKFAWWRAEAPEARSTLESLVPVSVGPRRWIQALWRSEGEGWLHRFRGDFDLVDGRIARMEVRRVESGA